MRNLQLLSSKCVADASALSGTLLTSIDYDTKAIYSATKAHLVAFDPATCSVSMRGGSLIVTMISTIK